MVVYSLRLGGYEAVFPRRQFIERYQFYPLMTIYSPRTLQPLVLNLQLPDKSWLHMTPPCSLALKSFICIIFLNNPLHTVQDPGRNLVGTAP